MPRLIVPGRGGGAFTIASPVLAPSGSRLTIASAAYNAFPGMALDGTDRLMVHRYGSAHNSIGGEADMRISTDGVTWPPGGTALVVATGSNDIRDPGIIVTSSGRWLLIYDRRNPYNSDNITAHWIYSDDNGSSWSSQGTFSSVPSAGTEASVVTSQPIEVAGAIYVPGYGEIGSDVSAGYWKSTDDGATFGSFVTIATSGSRDYQETQIRRLASGLWVALLRSESNHHTWRSTGGTGTTPSSWTTPTDVNGMTGRPDFVEYRAGHLVQFGRYLTSGDSPGYWVTSTDDGATWGTPQEIDPGSPDLWMYGAPVVTTTGRVEIVYCLESSSSTCGMYRRVYTDS